MSKPGFEPSTLSMDRLSWDCRSNQLSHHGSVLSIFLSLSLSLSIFIYLWFMFSSLSFTHRSLDPTIISWYSNLVFFTQIQIVARVLISELHLPTRKFFFLTILMISFILLHINYKIFSDSKVVDISDYYFFFQYCPLYNCDPGAFQNLNHLCREKLEAPLLQSRPRFGQAEIFERQTLRSAKVKKDLLM